MESLDFVLPFSSSASVILPATLQIFQTRSSFTALFLFKFLESSKNYWAFHCESIGFLYFHYIFTSILCGSTLVKLKSERLIDITVLLNLLISMFSYLSSPSWRCKKSTNNCNVVVGNSIYLLPKNDMIAVIQTLKLDDDVFIVLLHKFVISAQSYYGTLSNMYEVTLLILAATVSTNSLVMYTEP